MSFIHVPYDSLSQLIAKFATLNPLLCASLPNDSDKPPNFVLIDPNQYYGTYGGLVYDNVLPNYSKYNFEKSSIGHNVSIVWWNIKYPETCGDVNALSTLDGKYVAVTPKLYSKLILKSVGYKSGYRYSSYFGKTDR